MTAPTPPATAYYGVVVANNQTSRRKGPALRWSPRFGTAALATRWGKDAMDAGTATLAFTVRMEGGVRRVITAKPASAWRIIEHYLELVAALSQPPEE